MPSKILTTLFTTLLATSTAFAAPSYYNNDKNDHHKDVTTYCKWCLIKKKQDKQDYYDDEDESYGDDYDDDYDYDNEYEREYNNRYSSASHYWKKDEGKGKWDHNNDKKKGGDDYDDKYSQDGKYDVYKATLCGEKEVPGVIKGRNAFGFGIVLVDRQSNELSFAATHFNAAPLINAHIHGPAPTNQNASVLFDFSPPAGQTTSENPVRNNKEVILNEQQLGFLAEGLTYINLHNKEFPAGVVRGQLFCASKECRAPKGKRVVKFVEDGICNNAIFGDFY
ncbi:CHRD domain-containing protein [Phlyctochytrium arcticum]|nr:CHRD domain-containing protein [Phlyctochytrium arcticum]